MASFRFLSFFGAAALAFVFFDFGPQISYFCRVIGALILFWGTLYYLVREDDLRYGLAALVFAIIVQPFVDVIGDTGYWFLGAIACSAIYLILAGLLCAKLEKQRELAHAKIEAELAGYRDTQERLNNRDH